MGAKVYNEELMALTNYKSKQSIQNVIKNLLRLEGLAEQGDMVALSIVVDVKCSMGTYGGKFFDVLTPKQRNVITEVLVNDRTQGEVAEQLNITQQAISYLISSGIQRVLTFLSTGKIKHIPMTPEEKVFMLANYKSMSVNEMSIKLQRSENSCRVLNHILSGGGKNGKSESEGT